ncbi:MAG TPA: hypothetical protein VGO69_07130 [Pyrinomonadaceae bacterium]|nr:hypothetical protein [Pyrinomonadaceae bacterium]
MSRSFRFIISFAIIISCAASFPSQERDSEFGDSVVNGSLAELRDKHKVLLIVRRGALLDARGAEASVLSEVYKEGNLRSAYPRTYNMIARKLNKYMKENGSITASSNLSDADFILFFNVLEIRRPLGTPYAYGELFIILNVKSKPRILWKTRSSGMFVDDAVSDFISELKTMRGEK